LLNIAHKWKGKGTPTLDAELADFAAEPFSFTSKLAEVEREVEIARGK